MPLYLAQCIHLVTDCSPGNKRWVGWRGEGGAVPIDWKMAATQICYALSFAIWKNGTP